MQKAGVKGVGAGDLHFDGEVVAVLIAEIRVAESTLGGQGLLDHAPHIGQIHPLGVQTAAGVAAEERGKLDVSAPQAFAAQYRALFQCVIKGLYDGLQIILCHDSVSSHLTFSPT